MKKLVLLALFAATAAHAGDVKVAKHPADVAGCTVIGEFSSNHMAGAPKDLKRQAAAAGADTIIISQTNPFAFFSLNATAYKCER